MVGWVFNSVIRSPRQQLQALTELPYYDGDEDES